MIDENHDGRLSKEELEKALEELGSSFPAWRALYHANENGDGWVHQRGRARRPCQVNNQTWLYLCTIK